jgi:hypothetical protein
LIIALRLDGGRCGMQVPPTAFLVQAVPSSMFSASAAHSCNGEAIGIGAKLGDVEGIIFAGSLSAL